MKALSIKNPWAYLIAAGVKDIENRSWPTQHRGKLLIHASGQMDVRYREMSHLFTPQQWKAMHQQTQHLCVAGIFPMSAIIGEVDVVGCIQNSPSVWAEPNQWHWQLRNPILYKEPILNVKGKLSLWDFDTAAHGLAL